MAHVLFPEAYVATPPTAAELVEAIRRAEADPVGYRTRMIADAYKAVDAMRARIDRGAERGYIARAEYPDVDDSHMYAMHGRPPRLGVESEAALAAAVGVKPILTK